MLKVLNKIIKNRRIFIFWSITLIVFIAFGLFAFFDKSQKIPRLSPFPNGKNFAFTITADPDGNTLEKDRVIYDFLTSIGMKTTVAVWVKDATRSNGYPDIPKKKRYNPGDSCEREAYLQYMQELQNRGFEIALHTVSAGNDFREETVKGYENFKTYFNYYPKINIMHKENLDNLYWGKKVVNYRLLRMLVENATSKAKLPYEGEIPGSRYFWGDIAKEKTKYIRLWGTKDINTLKYNPSMPYHDPQKPFVNYWFSFSNGENLKIFNKLLSQENIQKLVEERGASIVYTHFASGFVKNGQLNDTFKTGMKYLATQKDGWFVPASIILDRLLLIKKIVFQSTENSIQLTNLNKQDVKGITLLVLKSNYFYDAQGKKLFPNEEGEVIIDLLKAGETITIFKDLITSYIDKEYPGTFEKINLFLQRCIIFISLRY